MKSGREFDGWALTVGMTSSEMDSERLGGADPNRATPEFASGVHHADRALHHVEVPGGGAYHLLLNDMVGGRNGKMQRGDTSDRPQWVVRRHTDRGCLSHSSDLLGLHKSAHMTDVGLNDVHGTRAENVVEFEV